ncbi:hypothetical protein DFH28DRAFT_1084534 [Melampsora americana]|nr:hypothetical protein DFH28DRAFT_1084534 [Melampsora americana]
MIKDADDHYVFHLKLRDHNPALEADQMMGPQFGCARAGRLKIFRKLFFMTDIVKWSDDASIDGALDFKVLLLRKVFGGTVLISMERKLDNLKKAMSQMRITLDSFKCHSIKLTRLLFYPKRGGTVKSLYVLSHILTQFEYFQSLHLQEYSETLQTDEKKFPLDELTQQDVKEVFAKNSDNEWDIDEDPCEPQKVCSYQFLILSMQNASYDGILCPQTYQAYLDYAFCGALYFAPLQSTYRQFKLECQIDTLPFPLWPVWAKAHSRCHTIVPRCKTLTSPKSLYRLTNVFSIPELKAICQREVIRSLTIENVVSEIMSPLFCCHQKLCEMSQIFTNLSRKEASLIGETMFRHLTSYQVPKNQ